MTNRAANATRAREQQVARWLEFAENQVPELLSPRRAAALDQMAGTYDALRETLRWLIERGDVERAARMVRALRSLWEDRGVDEGQRCVAAALAMPAAAARTAARATLLDHAAVLARGAGDHATALRLLSECLTIRRELGLTALLPVTLAHLALVVREGAHDYDQARSLLEEAVALARAQGNNYIHRSALYRLAQVGIDQGDLSAAQNALEENVSIARATADEWALGLVVGVFAVLAALHGQPVRALRLAGAGAAHRPGINLGGAEQAWLDRMLAPARHAIAETEQVAAWAAGQAMTLEQAVALALSDEAN